MTLETWVILGASALMAIAIVAQGLGWSRAPGRWDWLTLIARLGAVAALAAGLALATIRQGAWTPFNLRLLTPSLAIGALIIHLALTWRYDTDGAGPAIDLTTLALSLLAAGVWAGESLPTCPQRALPFPVQWGLTVVGAGGAVVAGSAGLMLLLRGFWARIGWDLPLPPREDVHAFLRQATMVTLVALGSGLTVGAWWTWTTEGTPTSDDPRSGWTAITWLVTAISVLAWRLRQRPTRLGQWAAVLAILAAATAIFGLVAVADIRHVPGM
jgi:hypothetical protein